MAARRILFQGGQGNGNVGSNRGFLLFQGDGRAASATVTASQVDSAATMAAFAVLSVAFSNSASLASMLQALQVACNNRIVCSAEFRFS